jgi:hypothetical protein
MRLVFGPFRRYAKCKGAFDKNMELLNPSLTLVVRCAQTLTLSCIFSTLQPLLFFGPTDKVTLWYIKVLVRILLCRILPHFCWLCLSGTWERFQSECTLHLVPRFEEWSSNVIVHHGYRNVTLCFIPSLLLCFRPLSPPSVVSTK